MHKYDVSDPSQQYIDLPEFKSRGFLSVEYFPFLKGKPLDDIALAYIKTLNPRSVRVSQSSLHADARTGRVTVMINEDGLIESIRMEIEIGLPEGTTCGESLRIALKYGIDSPQAKWYLEDPDNPIEGFVAGFGEYSKLLKDGTSVPFPKP